MHLDHLTYYRREITELFALSVITKVEFRSNRENVHKWWIEATTNSPPLAVDSKLQNNHGRNAPGKGETRKVWMALVPRAV